MLNKEDFTYFSSYLIGKAAEDRGIEVKKIFKQGELSKDDALQLDYKGHQEFVIYQVTSKNSNIAQRIQKNKALSKYVLRKAGIKVAKGSIFDHTEKDQIIKYCKEIKYPVVLKPLAGKHGTKVFIGINSDQKLEQALQQYGGKYRTVMVEKEFSGKEYRIFATNEKFVAATYRVPANVQGDGIHTIKELIQFKNKDPRRGSGHKKSLVKIRVDKQLVNFLDSQKKKLTTVLKKDEIIYLRKTSNLSTGGDSYDVTDIVHPEVKKLAVKIVQSVPGLAYSGIDYMTKDISTAPTDRNYIIVELNGSPMISMHHIPYSGKERNVAGAIIDQLFPETVKK